MSTPTTPKPPGATAWCPICKQWIKGPMDKCLLCKNTRCASHIEALKKK